MSSVILDKSLSGWQKAIDYSEAELKQLEQRERQLRAAISTFRANLKRGVPWPGEKSDLESHGEMSATHN